MKFVLPDEGLIMVEMKCDGNLDGLIKSDSMVEEF